MKKPRTQPAFATLTEAELDQLADWLRHQTYEIVLERIRKPRTEGGFDLNISRSPLERLYAEVALLDLINVKVPPDKKLNLAQFASVWGSARVPRVDESLAREGSSQLAVQSSPPESPSNPATDPIPQSELRNSQSELHDQSDRVAAIHDAILETALDLATSADNTPTQLLALQRLADFPARAQIRAQRLQLDRDKAERAFQLLTHKREMDTFRQEATAARLDLAKQSFTFRQKQHEDRLALAREKLSTRNPQSSTSPASDHLGPLARNWDEVGERARIHFNVSKEEWARRQSLHEKYDENGTPKIPGENPEANPEVNSTASISSVLSIPSSALSASSAVNPPSPTLKSEIDDLQSRVDSYTVERAQEYWAWRRAIAALPDGQPHPPFPTAHPQCPCGQPSPCPDHENETLGEYPTYFWSTSPYLRLYEMCLTERNLPYRYPSECVPEEFRIYTKRRR